MKSSEFAARVADVRAKASSSESIVDAILLLAEVVNNQTLARMKEDDVLPADEEADLQNQAYGAGPFDPAAPCEDSNATVDERLGITQADVRAATSGGGIGE